MNFLAPLYLSTVAPARRLATAHCCQTVLPSMEINRLAWLLSRNSLLAKYKICTMLFSKINPAVRCLILTALNA